jgi:ankyrin repeat protein/tetratricopeptide (TPR) repeat protein
MKKRIMKARITVLMASAILLGVGTRPACAATNEVSALLQKGLFEEEANQNLEAAIQAYQGVIAQTEKNRQYAATAIFRLGECYRKEGKTSEANVQYQLILSEFPDQTELAKLSRGYLGNSAVAAGAGSSDAARQAERQYLLQEIDLAQQELDHEKKLVEAKLMSANDTMAAAEKVLELKHQLAALDASQPVSGVGGGSSLSAEAGVLAQQIEGIEKLKADPEEEARGVAAIFPDEGLRKMLENLPRLQEQLATLKTNSTPRVYHIAIGSNGAADPTPGVGPGDPRFGSEQVNLQVSLIQERVDFIMGMERARLKVLQGGEGVSLAQAGSNGEAAPVTDEEEQEIKRIQEMIQNSPDLINAPGPGNVPPPPLSAAAQSDWLRVARYLLDHQARVDVLSPGNYDETPLITAAENGHKAMVELLLERGADINAKDKRGMTALHLAAQHGFQAVVEALIAHKADVNALDDGRRTPLAVAAAYKRASVVQQLLQAGANPNLVDGYGATCLADAAGNGSPESVKVLLAAGANPNAEGNNGRTPLSFAAEKGSAETVKMLLDGKGDPNGGRTDQPLLAAVHAQDTNTAALLLQAGANPNAVGVANWEYDGPFNSVHEHVTPIYFAVHINNLPMVQLLLKYKADPNDAQTTGEPLIYDALNAMSLGSPSGRGIGDGLPQIGALVAGGMPGGRRPGFRGQPGTPEDKAANGLAISELLLAYGAKVDAPDARGWTPLENVVAQHNPEMAELLLKAGADPNTKFQAPNNPNNRMTPLEFAAISFDSPTVQVLLDHRANPDIQDDGGQTPLSVAKMFQSNPQTQQQATKIVQMLVDAKANENLQRLSTIGVVRSGAKNVQTVFLKGTNAWNDYTLLDVLTEYYAPMYRENRPGPPFLTAQIGLQISELPGLDFPDFAKMRISRLDRNGRTNFITENLEAMFKAADCSKNVALQWGDIVEIPEADHNVNDTWTGLSDDAGETLRQCLASTVAIVVKGQTNLVTIKPLIYQRHKESGFPGSQSRVYLSAEKDVANNNGFAAGFGSSPRPAENPAEQTSFWLSDVVHGANVILTSSDLSRVRVTRTDAKTGRKEEMEFNLESTQPGMGGLWLRNGDVIEIPEK